MFPKKGESILDKYHEYRQKADDKVCCDYGLHVCLTSWNDRVRDEMKTLCQHHGVNSFKMFMAYDFMLNDEELYSAMEACKNLGALAQVHAENGSIIRKNVEKLKAQGVTGPEGHELSRPESVEAEAVNRACVIAKAVSKQPHNTRFISTHKHIINSFFCVERAESVRFTVLTTEILLQLFSVSFVVYFPSGGVSF